MNRAAVLLLSLLLVLTGCQSDGNNDNGPATITVWIGDTLPDRVTVMRGLADQFTAQTGTTVDLVSVDEDQFPEALTRTAADGQLPDVIGSQPLSALYTLATAQLLDIDAADDVVRSLGPATFERRALELTSDGVHQLAVPSDSWVQLIYYRKDWFQQANLAPPRTFTDVRKAAATLHQIGWRTGIVAPNVAGDNFTQQVFEEFALGNGCQVQSLTGRVVFDDQSCVATLSFYAEMLNRYSVPGVQDVDSVRTDYLAGKAAMVVWSSYLLDELAGLRDDVMPDCLQCQDDPLFLAHNTGVVAGMLGPYGVDPMQFGEISSWAIPVDSEREPAKAYVQFMMSEGYVQGLSFAPEGKLPLRKGPVAGSTAYLEAWRDLPIGVNRKMLLRDIYPPDVVAAVEIGPQTFHQWSGDLIGASLAELPIPAAVHAVVTRAQSPQQAAEEAAFTLREIQDTLPRY